MSTSAEIAAWLAAHGMHVFPLQPLSKRPQRNCPDCRAEQCVPELCPCLQADRPCHGLLAATADPYVIGRWWEVSPHANVGINAGRSGLVVLDLDRKTEPAGAAAPDVPTRVTDGLAAFAALTVAADQTVPDTLTVATPSDGRHLYFRAPDGLEVPSDASGRIGYQIDIRATGGYVLAPGSQIAAPPENRSGVYRRISARCDVAELPAWLVERVLLPVRPEPHAPNLAGSRPGPHPPGYWAAIWEGEIRKVEGQPGERWRLVYAAARRLANLATHDAAPWTAADVIPALVDSAVRRRQRTGKPTEEATAHRNATRGWQRGCSDGPESLNP